ncbi:MAG: 30S ribosomal protein S15 [Candidatus Riesia sp.]|nr:30S ribosomal protein S15 [Candidatus Riesia sp.]
MHKVSEILTKFNVVKSNTGSVIRQVIKLSTRINSLSVHLRSFRKDLHSKRGLINMVNQRKRFLKYLKSKDASIYLSLINALNLRK